MVLAGSVKTANLEKLKSARKFSKQERQSAGISAIANAILASDFSQNMESWLTKAFNEGVPSIYDKSADAVYNATNISADHNYTGCLTEATRSGGCGTRFGKHRPTTIVFKRYWGS